MAVRLPSGVGTLGREWVGTEYVANSAVCKTVAKAVGVRLPPGPPLSCLKTSWTPTSAPYHPQTCGEAPASHTPGRRRRCVGPAQVVKQGPGGWMASPTRLVIASKPATA